MKEGSFLPEVSDLEDQKLLASNLMPWIDGLFQVYGPCRKLGKGFVGCVFKSVSVRGHDKILIPTIISTGFPSV